MPIARHGSLLSTFQLSVDFGNHLASDVRVLDMRITVHKALTLFPKLGRGHYDSSGAVNKDLKLLRHSLRTPSFPLIETYIVMQTI
jgi:hypothetical protein